ncbi:hypothetical protein [Pseudomonas trivialis]|uniref:ABC-type branched-chain amino acid transport system, ATPase component n=1 Tax=Pseudomonas trivialis TaxID=200450 RepID=A0ABY0UQJ4_9PSED|nr:hypothetical protein [Pseudomonas trivialis]SDT03884.1 ABC-type branched-chain amino acid transport system, ATPase component [Pseudomonas trivialis]
MPCVGLRSSPNTSVHGVSETPQSPLSGLLRSPTRGKPARHRSPLCRGVAERADVSRGVIEYAGQDLAGIDPSLRVRQDLKRIYSGFPRLKAKRHTRAGLTSGGEQQMRFLIAEQNINGALSYASHGYVLDTGRVALSGSAAELLARGDLHAIYLGKQ